MIVLLVFRADGKLFGIAAWIGASIMEAGRYGEDITET